VDGTEQRGDGYVVPLDVTSLRARMRVWLVVTAVQVLVVVGLAVLITVLVGSLAAALPFLGVVAVISVMVMWKEPWKWRQLRAAAAYPPVFTDRGARLRLVNPSGHDLLVPWERVSKVALRPVMATWTKRSSWALQIHVEDVEQLVEGDPDRLRAVQSIERPPGMPFVYETGFVRATPDDIDAALRRSSDGRCALAS
jgi:hypothetical protein